MRRREHLALAVPAEGHLLPLPAARGELAVRAERPGLAGGVRQREAVGGPREIRRQNDLCMGNITAVGVIMDLAGALIANALARATTSSCARRQR